MGTGSASSGRVAILCDSCRSVAGGSSPKRRWWRNVPPEQRVTIQLWWHYTAFVYLGYSTFYLSGKHGGLYTPKNEIRPFWYFQLAKFSRRLSHKFQATRQRSTSQVTVNSRFATHLAPLPRPRPFSVSPAGAPPRCRAAALRRPLRRCSAGRKGQERATSAWAWLI